jgi:hypothetical protein
MQRARADEAIEWKQFAAMHESVHGPFQTWRARWATSGLRGRTEVAQTGWDFAF